MATQPNDIIEVAARMEFDGQDDVINTYQFRHEGSSGIPDSETLEDILDIMEDVYTIILAIQSILLLYQDLRVTNVTQSTLLGTVAWPTLTAGTEVGDALPPGCCGLVSFNTIVSRVSPRKYFGAFTTASLDSDGTLDLGALSDLVAIGALLLTTRVETNSSWRYGYLSPKTLGFEVPVGSTVRDVVAYQRRRKQGRGS